MTKHDNLSKRILMCFGIGLFLFALLLISLNFQKGWKPTNADPEQNIKTYVSPDDNFTAFLEDSLEERVFFVDGNGDVITLTENELNLSDDNYALEHMGWSDNTYWFGTKLGIQLLNIYSYNLNDQSLYSFDVSSLNITGHEFALNCKIQTLVYSDYHFVFDADSELKLYDQPNTLYLYNLETKSIRTLLTSTKRHEFLPTWVDNSTIEYNYPDGENRVSQSVTTE